MAFLKNYALYLALGTVLALFGVSFLSWKFYAAIIPLIVLAEWKAA